MKTSARKIQPALGIHPVKMLLLTVFILFSTLSCSPSGEEGAAIVTSDTSAPVPLIISVEPECRLAWNSILQNHPLPEGFVSGAGTESPTQTQRPIELEIYAGEPGRIEQSEAAGKDTFLLSREPLIPVVPLLDTRTSIDMQTALQLPLRTIHEDVLPLKGLPVNGLFIDDEQYPLIRNVFLRFSDKSGTEGSRTDETRRHILMEWVRDLQKTAAGSVEAVEPDVVWVGGVGDMMLQRGIEDIFIARGEQGLHEIFNDTLPVLRAQDYLIGNLEGAVTEGGIPTPKSYNFRFSPQVLPWLKSAGFDYVSITNNHCYDYGTEGFTDTLDHLKRNGIATSGAGLSPEAAFTPYVTEIRAIPLKVLSVGAYPREKNGFDGRSQAGVREDRPGIIFSGPRVLSVIRQFSGQDNIDIVIAHGGQEWEDTPSDEQKEFYRSCIDAGADILMAHHPHVLQGMEAYNGGLIAYSLGNFLFPGMYGMPHAEETILLSIGFVQQHPVYIQPYPVKIDNREIRLESPDSLILSRFFELSRAFIF